MPRNRQKNKGNTEDDGEPNKNQPPQKPEQSKSGGDQKPQHKKKGPKLETEVQSQQGQDVRGVEKPQQSQAAGSCVKVVKQSKQPTQKEQSNSSRDQTEQGQGDSKVEKRQELEAAGDGAWGVKQTKQPKPSQGAREGKQPKQPQQSQGDSKKEKRQELEAAGDGAWGVKQTKQPQPSQGAWGGKQPKQPQQSQGDSKKEKRQELEAAGDGAWGVKQTKQPQPSQGAWGGKQPKQPQQSQGDSKKEKRQELEAAGDGAWGVKQTKQPQPSQDAWGGKQPKQPQQRQGDSKKEKQQELEAAGDGAWGVKQTKQPQPSQGAWGGKQPKQPQHSQGDSKKEKRQELEAAGDGAWGVKQTKQPQPSQGAWGGKQPKQPQQSQSDSNVEKRKQPESESDFKQPKQKEQGDSSIDQSSPKQQPQQEKTQVPSIFTPYHGSKNICLNRGTAGKPIVLEANYIEMILNNMKDYAYHYHVDFEPEKPKKFIRLAFEEYRKKVLPNDLMAFDGKASVFSPRKLDPQNLVELEVTVVPSDSNQSKVFKVSMKETYDSLVELKSLRNYHTSRIFDKPMRALQCMEVILSSPCHNKGVRGGRSFYVPPENRKNADLEDGYELWLGLFQAPILGDQPLLNIDVSHKAFPSPTNLVQLAQTYRGFNNGNLDQRDCRSLHEFLNDLNIAYTPPPSFGATKKTYKYNELKGKASEETFQLEDGTRMTVEKYYKSKGCQLKYPNLPVLHVGSSVRNILLPMEFCGLEQGQITNKQCTDRQIRNMIRFAATSTDVRKQKIMNLFNYFQHNNNPVIKQFGIQLGCTFQKINGRILNAPAIEYGDRRQVRPMRGSWRMDGMTFLKPQSSLQWKVLISDKFIKEHQVRDFADKICSVSKQLKMNLSSYTVDHEYDTRRLDSVFQNLKSQKVDFVLVVIPNYGDGYSKVKQGSELRHGVLTQCVKSGTVMNRNNVQTIQNILLKINTKLTGINHKISTASQTTIFSNSIMFVGADVTHPSPGQTKIPSVVGVVASHDPFGTQYNVQYRLQDPKKEIIESMDDILYNHLQTYKKFNNKFPEQIIYYRDGVADGQFPLVSQFEFPAMDKACARINLSYRPKITCVIVQKRHHTRFFPNKNDSIGKFNNVPPGTIVDKTITHPNESEFFLVSHESIQGTARPAKYCIIRDDAKINIDTLQALTFNLCHLFPRCNRSVSYAAPAYLAHLVAARGRVYLEGARIDTNNLKREYGTRNIKREIIEDKPMFFV